MKAAPTPSIPWKSPSAGDHSTSGSKSASAAAKSSSTTAANRLRITSRLSFDIAATLLVRARWNRVEPGVKAAVIYENGGPDVLRYEDVPDPDCPDGCVVIDVEAISIEGGDLLARAGSPPPSVPHTVGYLAAGSIVEVGAGVEDRAVGDRVVTLNAAGSHCSKRAVPAMSTWPIPDGLDAAPAACVPVAYGTAQECLLTAGNLGAGQTALTHPATGGRRMAAVPPSN